MDISKGDDLEEPPPPLSETRNNSPHNEDIMNAHLNESVKAAEDFLKSDEDIMNAHLRESIKGAEDFLKSAGELLSAEKAPLPPEEPRSQEDDFSSSNRKSSLKNDPGLSNPIDNPGPKRYLEEALLSEINSHDDDDIIFEDSIASPKTSLTNPGLSPTSTSTASILAPDWLQDFEEQQRLLLNTLLENEDDSEHHQRSVRPSIMDIQPPPTNNSHDTVQAQRHSSFQLPTEDVNFRSIRSSSILPDWLRGFETEQQTLLEAMKRKSARDSLAMMEDSLGFLFGGDTIMSPTVGPFGEEDNSNLKKESVDALGDGEQGEKKKSTQEKAKQQHKNKPASAATRVTAMNPKRRSTVLMPDWIQEFEEKQKKVLDTLHERASVFLQTTANLGPQPTTIDTQLESSFTHHTAPSIALAQEEFQWLKELEDKQKDLLKELNSELKSTQKVEKDDKKSPPKEDEAEESTPTRYANPTILLHVPLPRRQEYSTAEVAAAAKAAAAEKSSTAMATNRRKSSMVAWKNGRPVEVRPHTGEKTPSTRQLQEKPSPPKNQTESKLQFAEMIAKALKRRGGSKTSGLEALRHVDNLKEELRNSPKNEDDWQMQISKLPQELIDTFNQGQGAEDLIKWLLPMRNNSRSSMASPTAALLQQQDQNFLFDNSSVSNSSGDRNNSPQDIMVQNVLQTNFSSVEGSSCLETIQEYAVLRLGKKKRNKGSPKWASLLSSLNLSEADDVHLAVRNALASWIVREILATSKDEISSRMCFRAIFLVSSLKVELERVAPERLAEIDNSVINHTPESSQGNAQQKAKSTKRKSGRKIFAKIPAIVKKLLNRTSSHPDDSPPDLAPESDQAMDGSANVNFVRASPLKKEADNVEEHAKITSRESTFVKVTKTDHAIRDSVVAKAVGAYKPPANLEDASEEITMPWFPPSKNELHGELKERVLRGAGSSNPVAIAIPLDTYDPGFEDDPIVNTDMDESTNSASNHQRESSANSASEHEEMSTLPLPQQDALRLIRTILGPDHREVTVGLCFEAIRVYAALIRAWNEFGGSVDEIMGEIDSSAKSESRPSEEELKLKSLERSVFRRGAFVAPREIDFQLEFEKEQAHHHQEDVERKARESIARRRQAKKDKKKLKQTKSAGKRTG